MIEAIEKLKAQIIEFEINSKESLEGYRLTFLSRKGLLPALLEGLKSVPNDQKRTIGQLMNEVKSLANSKFDLAQEQLDNTNVQVAPPLDLTLPVVPNQEGSIHPLTLVRQEIIQIFERLGFNVSDGPEIETDWYNFSALNFPENHPAREMQDTFFIQKSNGEQKDDVVLRTHTSNVQIRLMERQKPPLRSIMPGRVFRNEAISARAHCFFHQIEGIYIDENVGFKDLKDTLYQFAKELFGQDTQVRFRPSFFPFTEPSAEMDISCEMHKPGVCRMCGGSQNVCKGSGWVEILGSGMIDPAVLENCGIDSEKFTGFAFGMGIERIAMLKYRVRDLRLYSENDVRFLKQFESV